ncbi:MAG: MarR family transcriptional regulator [Gammaproteobacteria bacterium]|nr:MarR family transcriptional regulator [Gammaproteobacteria bacterium]MBT8445391.1 MarR family transcriptional regulator [Gammaproteobacteria bacterium]NND35858.1 MarR family transcriptional regulator [Gammaproteobacteria bacterium]
MPSRTPSKNHAATEVADLILQLSRAAYADCARHGLTQAQWIAMRFFSRANRFSRTVSGFAEYHATTRGTASQTVSSLVDKGYLARRPSPRDGRSVEFELTPAARGMLGVDPLERIVRAADRLSVTQQSRTVAGLRAVLDEFETERDCVPAIGPCRLCGHLGTDAETGSRCRLMRESLDKDELDELCVRFNAPA